MVEAFASVQVGESDRSVLLVLAKYLQGGWSSLGPKDKAALGQDPYDLMDRPFDKAAARAVMADAWGALVRQLQQQGVEFGFADQPLAHQVGAEHAKHLGGSVAD